VHVCSVSVALVHWGYWLVWGNSYVPSAGPAKLMRRIHTSPIVLSPDYLGATLRSAEIFPPIFPFPPTF